MRAFLTPLLALLALASAARAEIEFSGVLAMSGRTLFALTDTATARSDWVPLQGRFAEHVVSHYDRATETLTLTRQETSLQVRLKDDAKVQPARFELTGRISFGAGETVDIERATLVFDQENVFPLKDGITYRITPVRRADGTLRYSISIEQRTAANRIDRLSAPSIVTLPHQSFTLRVGDFAFSFTPK
jgi:hypothetical protein